jgi:trans-aconitate 2-methyltransferase
VGTGSPRPAAGPGRPCRARRSVRVLGAGELRCSEPRAPAYLAAQEPYAAHTAHTAQVEQPDAHDPETYLALLARPGWRVDAWETTYLHLLSGPDPVLRWVSGTGARPVLQALPDPLRARFEAEYGARLRTAYPEQPHGTVLPFRRVFCVAHRDDA